MSVAIYFSEENVTINEKEISILKQKALSEPSKIARFCLHKNHDEKVQEMVIAICNDTYISPHRQRNKRKTYMMIEGYMLVVFFNDEGHIIRRMEMGPAASGYVFLSTFPSSPWHTIRCLSDMAVYLETIAGPYHRAQTEFAPWAPQRDDPRAIRAFLDRLASQET